MITNQTGSVAGLTLREPDQIDWDNYNPGGKFVAPPPAVGADGKPIVYYGQLPSTLGPDAFAVTKDGYRQYVLDPITLVKGGAFDGYRFRFTRVSTKPFIDGKTQKPKNANGAGNLLRSVGLTAKPQKNAEYDAAIKLTAGKVAAFTIDWRAKNKDTGEEVRGYENFPDDPTRPGQKKAILRAADGDTYRDASGAQVPVTSEVLFANAEVRWFQTPKK
jgi:hypothetical protein